MTVISQFKEGATIQVAQGVLRGIGPMGPRGFTGMTGPQGPQGIPGPQPEMAPVASAFSCPVLRNVSNDGTWFDLDMTANSFLVGELASLNADGSVTISGNHVDGVAVMLTGAIVVRPGASGSEDFTIELGFFEGSAGAPFASTTFFHTNGSVPSSFTITGQTLVTTGTTVSLRARVFGADISPQVTFSSLRLTRAGGAKGPTGDTGPVGPQGATGPQGPPGNGGMGFATFDALDAVGDSDADPGGSPTNSQGLPYPVGAQRPAVPFVMRNLADAVARRVVRRFSSTTDLNSASDKEVGQVAFLTSNNSLAVIVNNSGAPAARTIAQVMYGAGDPPAGIYPAGTIYFKVV